MTRKLRERLAFKTGIVSLAACFLITVSVQAQELLPTAKSIAAEMGIAWNIGNSLEVPKDPLLWGNPLPSQRLIDSVKAGGFKTIRIPCAWNSHADTVSCVIDPNWLAQVKTVVDYCIKDSLFVILNSHWDGGWLEECVSADKQEEVNRRQNAYWTQIANYFKDYGRHLLFAGTNEPAVQDVYGTPFGADRMAILNSYHQTFINAVRATGGNNASRTLVVQGPRTDIELTNQVMNTMPTDQIEGRLMAEVHFYPYQFALMEKDEDWGKVYYYWGKNNLSTTDTERNTGWCDENFVDSMFNFMKTKFVDKDIPVVIGEFGAVKRMTLTGESLERHILSRRIFYNYVVSAALSRGMIPAAWDTGDKGNLTMTIFDRKTGEIFDLGLLNAIRSAAGLPKLPGDTSLVKVATGDYSMKVLYSADTSFGQVQLTVTKQDMTPYDTIIVRAYVNGETDYDSAGVRKFGWLALSVVTMSDNWTWREGRFGAITMNNWKEYRIPILTDQSLNEDALVPANPSKIDFLALQAYSDGFRGTIYVDWIIFKSKAGAYDTVYTFNVETGAKYDGNVDAVSLIETSAVPGDQEWKTVTRPKFATSTIRTSSFATASTLRAFMSNGMIHADFSVPVSGTVQVILRDLQGRKIHSGNIRAKAGMNRIKIGADYSGLMLLEVRQGANKLTSKVVCR